MYSYTEALAASVEYFDGDELAAKVFVDKYALRDNDNNILEKTPDDMHHRLAKEFARIEKKKFKKPLTEDEIFELFKGFKRIVPQGSPMYGIGNSKYISISNCTLAESPLDSYGSICKTDEQLVQLSKRRCGVGIDISNLRPVNASVTNSAKTSSGITSFMERYSNSIREVGQNSRRGALMITCDVTHPEIENFINAKNDETKVTGANISVKLSNEFLVAVKNNTEFTHRWPVDSDTPIITKTIQARDLWNKIIHAAWNRAEPGLLFWDTILNESVANCYTVEGYGDVGTNPCQPADATVLTKRGISNLGQIQVGDQIWSQDGWTTIVKKWSTGVKPTYKYKTTAGYFYGTENHRIVENGTKIEVDNADCIDILSGQDVNADIKLIPEYIMDGLVVGDGSYKDTYSILYIGNSDTDYFDSEINHLIVNQFDGEAYKVKTSITKEELPYTYLRNVPNRYITGDVHTICSFLRGIYTANGSVCDNRITLKSASLQMIEDIQLMLNSIGIKSYYTTNLPTKVKFSNGEYECKQSYDLNITRDREKFVKLIGFIQEYKNQKIKITKCYKSVKTTYDIIEKVFTGYQEVFDITVDNSSNTYWTGGVNVSNCSEIPLSPLDSCRLLVLNLLTYVNNPFTKKAEFDFDRFTSDAKLAQRLMDDIVDLEAESIEKIIKKIKSDPQPKNIKTVELEMWEKMLSNCLNGRRTGTGLTGIGDTIAALNLKYCSTKSIEVTELIYKTLKLACYSASVEMAKELGHFPVWNHQKEKNNPFLLRIKDEDPKLYDSMSKYGRRNIAILTSAPVGSVSLLTRTTSGIEPLFMMSHLRRKKINSNEDGKVDFVDKLGDKWQEFKVYHPTLKLWMEITNNTDETKSPWYGCCASDINWKNRVKLQAAAQLHIDHAISSTLNLPETVTEQQVAEIYETAWETGIIKGITVYRDNCRTGVLIADKKEKRINTLVKTQAPTRPKSLPCDIHHLIVKGIKYFVIVGLLEDDPYEIFISRNCDSDGESLIPKSITNGNLVKQKRGHYNLINGDDLILQIVSMNCEEHEEALARLVSTSLRHGADINFIVHQLEKTRGDMQSFSKAMARTLKKYIQDGTEVKGEECPTCSGKLIRSEGCVSCSSCSWSKC